MVPMRIGPVLVLEGKAERRGRGIISQQHEKLYENHPEFILTELEGKWKIGE